MPVIAMHDDASVILERPVAGEDAQTREAAPWLCCRVCETRIALASAGISFDGDHLHRFLNPHGFEFRIALFDAAPGCRDEGERTEFFSWFPGYAWKMAVCSGCRAHLGWVFECVGPPGIGEPPDFHGLVADRLRSESGVA